MWPDHYFLQGGAYRFEIISTPSKKGLVQFGLSTEISHIRRCQLLTCHRAWLHPHVLTVQVKGQWQHLEQVVQYMNLRPLKPKQVEALHRFVSGHDVFVVLTTRYGKSVIFAVLPLLFDILLRMCF